MAKKPVRMRTPYGWSEKISLHSLLFFRPRKYLIVYFAGHVRLTLDILRRIWSQNRRIAQTYKHPSTHKQAGLAQRLASTCARAHIAHSHSQKHTHSTAIRFKKHAITWIKTKSTPCTAHTTMPSRPTAVVTEIFEGRPNTWSPSHSTLTYKELEREGGNITFELKWTK